MKKLRNVFVIIILLILVFNLAVYISNNLIAARLKRRLLDCPLPEDTQLLESKSIAGKMYGNGNGMQWFGIILVKSDSDEQALYDWYHSKVDFDPSAEWIEVFEQDTPYVIDKYHNAQFKNYTDAETCFQICIVRDSIVGAESSVWEALLNSDLRGH